MTRRRSSSAGRRRCSTLLAWSAPWEESDDSDWDYQHWGLLRWKGTGEAVSVLYVTPGDYAGELSTAQAVLSS